MIDNLILAYRSEFYNWNLEKIITFYKKNKGIFWILIIFALMSIGTIIYSLINRASVPMLVLILVELILGIACDRLVVKRYQQFISTKQEHMKKIKLFLETAIPGKNLFHKKQVEKLIDRLSMRIDTGTPFNRFKARFNNFGKVIVLPIIAYIAGVYTRNVSELEFMVVLPWAVSIILIVGLVYILGDMISQGIQKIVCRNYDAVRALKEDLLDIHLLFFCE